MKQQATRDQRIRTVEQVKEFLLVCLLLSLVSTRIYNNLYIYDLWAKTPKLSIEAFCWLHFVSAVDLSLSLSLSLHPCQDQAFDCIALQRIYESHDIVKCYLKNGQISSDLLINNISYFNIIYPFLTVYIEL